MNYEFLDGFNLFLQTAHRYRKKESAPAAYCSRSGFFFPAVCGYSTVSVIG